MSIEIDQSVQWQISDTIKRTENLVHLPKKETTSMVYLPFSTCIQEYRVPDGEKIVYSRPSANLIALLKSLLDIT